jgi:hypothetical protein
MVMGKKEGGISSPVYKYVSLRATVSNWMEMLLRSNVGDMI